MSTERPTVSPQVLAALIESTPDRVRRRLDRTPDAAANWNWRAGDEAWSVDTGAETVTLPRGHVFSVDQLSCTCLLSPRCFHVLACLTRLEVAISEGEDAESVQMEERGQVESGADEDLIEPSEKQQHAAGELVKNVAQMLRVGVGNTGVVVQSGMLRAAHQCRAEGLHRLAALGLRVVAGTSQFRARSPEADPAQLAEDVAAVLETGRHVLGRKAIAGFWIGTARRKQMPVRPRKLHGLLAEPIVTRSGYAGAAVYFLGEDDQIYTASDVRPGGAQQARDAYLGGIEIGPMIQPAKQLARGLYLGTDLTASQDGRLGRGKSIKIVEQGQSTWQVGPIQERFRRPLLEQWHAVYGQASLPADARPAGWDFVFLVGAVVGAVGAVLLLQLTTEDHSIRLAIENESESLYFRENLGMLSHAPGLRLQVIGRVILQEPTIMCPLAVAQVEEGPPKDDEPRIEVPKALAGRVCLGFDEIQRPYLVNAEESAVVLSAQKVQPDNDDPLGSLHRRWIATMLSGSASQRQSNRNTVAAETALLNLSGFATGAALLDALSRSHSDGGPTSTDTFLATAVYLRCCRCELANSSVLSRLPSSPGSS
jgi:hypothetical protein